MVVVVVVVVGWVWLEGRSGEDWSIFAEGFIIVGWDGLGRWSRIFVSGEA